MNIAIIKAGGIGSRMRADIPKQFVTVDSKPVIIYTLEAFENHPGIDAIVVVCVQGWEKTLLGYTQRYGITKITEVVQGGETSLKSIKNGVDAVRGKYSPDDTVLIHDANRPLVSQEIISDVLVQSGIYGMAVAAIPCDDEVAVVREWDKGSREFADHKELYRIQTPDAYRLSVLCDIFDAATEDQLTKLGATNVLAIRQGYEMHFAMGSSVNIRLTTSDDIVLFESILRSRNGR